jgi:hypothetical protein
MYAADVPEWVKRWAPKKTSLPTKLRAFVAGIDDAAGTGTSVPQSPKFIQVIGNETAPTPSDKVPMPHKLRTFVAMQQDGAPPQEAHSPAAAANTSESPIPVRSRSPDISDPENLSPQKHPAQCPNSPVRTIEKPASEPGTPGASRALHDLVNAFTDLEKELDTERARRLDAEEGKRAAVETAQALNGQVEMLHGEIERLTMMLRRFDVQSVETSDEAHELSATLTRMAEEAKSVAETRAEKEKEAENTVSTCPPSPLGVYGTLLREKEEAEELKFQEMQATFMGLQYDDIFSALEAREADSTLTLIRASWLRARHREEEMEELLPKRGVPLPIEARVPAAALRAIFSPERSTAAGGGGYRKVDLPFLTLMQFWCSTEPPDPEEHTFQAVISYLNQRWEEFTERDVGILFDADTVDENEAVFWLVTSRARAKMAEAHQESQHAAYLSFVEKRLAEKQKAKNPEDEMATFPTAAMSHEEIAGAPTPAGWESVGSNGSDAGSKSSSRGMEDVL